MLELSTALPTEFDLPDTDDQPVDNELQILLPALMRAILALLWADRNDWFMGVNLGLYYDPNLPAIGPDGFLSLGVPRLRDSGELRLSYLVWHEGIMPQWVLEVVSQKPGGECTEKFAKYAQMGILYYTIYNPKHTRRDKHDRFEVYRLIDGEYVRQTGDPVWMPELGLGIGTAIGQHEGITKEWLYWYDAAGSPHPAPVDVIAQARRRAQQAELAQQQAETERQQAETERQQEQQLRQQAEQQLQQEQQRRQQAENALQQEQQRRDALLNKLRQQGIDPDLL